MTDAGGKAEASPFARAGEVPQERRVYLEVFGCQMNKLDAELMMGVLDDEGYRLTDRVEDAGVVLYHTCAIREQAENKVFSKVGALKALKKKRPDLVIGVLGCSAQNHQRDILKKYPQVGVVCGPGEFLRIPELITESRKQGQVAALDLDAPVKFTRRRNFGPLPFQAFVSVMRGCDMACTYCVVPRTRGPEVSRPVREIVDECKSLADSGVQEITLLGQTVNSYGKRLAPGRQIGLHHVLHELDKISGLERIRFITSHPRFMGPELIEAMGGLSKVCEYLHLPVQSGSDTVLKRMRRSHKIDYFRRTIEAAHEAIPDLGVATDIIVGYCDETDAEFQETYQLLEDMRFQNTFVFRYSERAGTDAADSEDNIPDDVKRERNQALLDLQLQIGAEIRAGQVGSTAEVLVEGPSKHDPNRWAGRNRRHQIVVFPARQLPGNQREELAGELVNVKITESTALTLIGERV
ncbi:MAG: tRNA (N6-isopentenyl adenosine(37)-C2)-methylthiotransferase MiaB [Planctomycetota bacterium]